MKTKRSRTTGHNSVKMPTPVLLLVVTVFGALIAAQLVVMRAQSRETKESKMDQSFPIVDYNAPAPSNLQERSSREARNRRYDGRKAMVEKSPTGDERMLVNDALVALPALPVYGSNAVVLGEVGDAHAYLSNDKSGVYSEFTIQVEKVFKDDSGRPLTLGSSIQVDRLGGRVRYSPARTSWYHVAGENMPQPSKHYIFFLQRGSEAENYSILTAYEIQSGRVHPLDGSNVKPPQPWAGDAYEGTDEGSFLNKLQEAIAVAMSSGRP